MLAKGTYCAEPRLLTYFPSKSARAWLGNLKNIENSRVNKTLRKIVHARFETPYPIGIIFCRVC